jgi:creatinine amidohydrolase/Fe(II)-dependent formamide hydrolase-like protein
MQLRLKSHVPLLVTLATLMLLPAGAQELDTVFLEELTWTEVSDLLGNGYTTIIIPTAGTEQNGPHLALGKHKYRINYGSEKIARTLGNALVAPVITYVPEGRISPPEGHMNYPGTISIPTEVFQDVLEYSARSLMQHGFMNILFIGDSGGNQEGMKIVAEALNLESEPGGARVHFVSAWYAEGVRRYMQWLLAEGYTKEEIGQHAGLADTALLMATAPEHVRDDIDPAINYEDYGVSGDPTLATKALGEKGMEFLIQAAIEQISAMVTLKEY